MPDLTRDQLIIRLDTVEANLRNCNSASDVHAVGNMRGIAQGIRHCLEEGSLSKDDCIKMLKRLEDAQVEFFKKKFVSL